MTYKCQSSQHAGLQERQTIYEVPKASRGEETPTVWAHLRLTLCVMSVSGFEGEWILTDVVFKASYLRIELKKLSSHKISLLESHRYEPLSSRYKRHHIRTLALGPSRFTAVLHHSLFRFYAPIIHLSLLPELHSTYWLQVNVIGQWSRSLSAVRLHMASRRSHFHVDNHGRVRPLPRKHTRTMLFTSPRECTYYLLMHWICDTTMFIQNGKLGDVWTRINIFMHH